MRIGQATVGQHSDDDDSPSGIYRHGVELDRRGETPAAEMAWRSAAELGHSGAQLNLGALLIRQGGPASAREAETWWRKAADAGHTRAQYNIAQLTTSSEAEPSHGA